jgi:glutaminyl-tRNA synthetase
MMGVLRPLKVVIENYPHDQVEALEAVNNPEDPGMGTRSVPFLNVIYIEQEDFREDPPKKYFRLAPGREVRLRYAYFITCREAIKDPQTGEVVELRCTYDPSTRGGDAPDGRKVKATLHWVSAGQSVAARVRLYDRLFVKSDPDEKVEGKSFKDFINPASLEVLDGCRLEPALAGAAAGAVYQFERLGYFCVDDRESSPQRPVFNRTVTLKDAWARIEGAGQKKP